MKNNNSVSKPHGVSAASIAIVIVKYTRAPRGILYTAAKAAQVFDHMAPSKVLATRK